MTDAITICSSNGELVVDALTGKILDASAFSDKAPARIDVAELRRRYGEGYAERITSFDILDTGTWDVEGNYAPPCAEWRAETKAHVMQELADACDVDLHPDEMPDDLFWKLPREEFEDWALRNMDKRDERHAATAPAMLKLLIHTVHQVENSCGWVAADLYPEEFYGLIGDALGAADWRPS